MYRDRNPHLNLLGAHPRLTPLLQVKHPHGTTLTLVGETCALRWSHPYEDTVRDVHVRYSCSLGDPPSNMVVPKPVFGDK